MTIADYVKYFSDTEINFNTDKMSRSHFLVLNDTNKATKAGGLCKGTCSHHKFTVTSATTQTVYLRAATW